MQRARRLIRRGFQEDSTWRLGLGAALGLLGLARKAARRKPEVVQRVVVRPGETIVVDTRPGPGVKSPHPAKRHKRGSRGRK